MTRHDAWRAAVGLLMLLASASMFAWWSAPAVPVPRVASLIAWAGALAALASAVGLCLVPQRTLRWDRQQWWVASGTGPERAGELVPVIDFGGWLLLRFKTEPAARFWSGRGWPEWIALQRRGLEADWHALRCTVYAQRPLPPSSTHLGDA